MKKILSIIMISVILICATACGEGVGTSADVHVFYYTYSDTYISSVRSALDNELNKLGVSYQDYDSNGNQTTRLNRCRLPLQKGQR